MLFICNQIFIFIEWKKNLENGYKKLFIKTGEVWWCSVGLNIAQESCGKGKYFRRPVLIIKKLSDKNFIGIPLSTKNKTGTWFTNIQINGERQFALLYQIKMFSSNRLQRRIFSLDNNQIIKVKEKLKQLLEF